MPRWLITILLLSPFVVHGQNVPDFFFEIIGGDSVKLFIDRADRFTDKHCAFFARYTRIDSDGNFNGFFKDITFDNKLLGTGRYIHGRKHGYFELFHGNGKPMLRGFYDNNLPVGRWEMFYNNGLPYRTIIMQESDTLLWTLVNPKGHVDVSNGNGSYILYREYQSRFYHFLDLKGTVKNGRADGLWATDWKGYFAEGMAFTLKEWYDNGKMIRSNFPNEKLRNQSRLVKFLPDTYLANVERFSLHKCYDTIRHSVEVNFRFKEKIQNALDKRLRTERNVNGSLSYRPGLLHCAIQFFINQDGIPEQFESLTSFGEKILPEIIPIIRERLVFKVKSVPIYMYLQLNYKDQKLSLLTVDFFSNKQTLNIFYPIKKDQ